MTDPYLVLGLSADSDDEAIRRRYLDLVKEFSPERHPERFAEIRRAYERLKDLDTRLRLRLFESGKHETIDNLIEDLECQNQRRRVPLSTLLAAIRKP